MKTKATGRVTYSSSFLTPIFQYMRRFRLFSKLHRSVEHVSDLKTNSSQPNLKSEDQKFWMNKQHALVLVSLLSINIGCSHLTSSLGRFKNSAISKDSLAPASLGIKEDAQLDQVHVKSKVDYHFTLGESYSLEGRSPQAIEEFKQALVYDNSSPELRMRLAVEFLKLGLFNEALEQAQISVQQNPDYTDVRLLLGGLYSSIKLFDRALKHYEYLRIQNPDNHNIQLLIGGIYFEQKKYPEAKKIFREIIAEKNFEKKHLAYFYLAKGELWSSSDKARLNRAEKLLKKALAHKYDFTEGMDLLASIYEETNQMGKAIGLLTKFQEEYGPNPQTAHKLSRYYLMQEKYDKAIEQLTYIEGYEPNNIDIKMKRALILIELKKYDSAISSLEIILDQKPNSDKVRFYLGAVHEEKKNFKKAIEHYDKILSDSTYYIESTIHMAYLYKELNQQRNAEVTIEKGLEVRPDVAQFYTFYASMLIETKQYKKADEFLKLAVSSFPQDNQLKFFYGNVNDKLGKIDKTITVMREIIESDPENIQALNYLAYTLAEENKNLDEAEGFAKRALDLNPKDGYVLDTYGWVLFKQGKIKMSIIYLERANSFKKTESIIAEHLGDAYYRYQLVEKAKQMYIKAKQHETNNAKTEKLQYKIQVIEAQKVSPRFPASVK